MALLSESCAIVDKQYLAFTVGILKQSLCYVIHSKGTPYFQIKIKTKTLNLTMSERLWAIFLSTNKLT